MSGRWEQVAQTPLAKPQESADVAVIGGGPAGLTAAARLRQLLPGAKVVVLEREAKAGGIPRHAFHQGYGLRDLHKSLTGPAYAQRLADAAATAGADLRLHTQVTGWSADGALELTSPAGVAHLYARAVVLASGCRERPRSARLVAGSRPRGVMNTGTLQQLVYLRGKAPGTRALVVGAEHVAFSAVATLAHGGARTVAVTTELPRHQSYGALRWAATARYATVPDIGTAVAPRPSPLPKPPPVLAHTAVMEIHGRERVTGVTVLDLRSGESRVIECDTVVFTGDWLPDHELAVSAGLVLDAGTRGPRVDGALRTEREGLFAAGNVLHGAETGDVAALSGRHVARTVTEFLGGKPWPQAFVPIECEPPLHWITPGAIEARLTAAAEMLSERPVVPPRGHYLLRAHEELIDARLSITQNGLALGWVRVPRVMPGRSASLTTRWADSVDPDGGPVVIRVTKARLR
jgi:thioredoxin reductase